MRDATDPPDEPLDDEVPVSEIEPLKRLSKDLKEAARTLSRREARYLVDAFYTMQRNRIRANNQIDSLTKTQEPHVTLAWFASNASILEQNVRAALDVYGSAHIEGRWLKRIKGIGPVLSAGILAHCDVEPWRCVQPDEEGKRCYPEAPHPDGACGFVRTRYAGRWWRFAGLDPTVVWQKDTKRPWNAALKTLCWKCSKSFVLVSGRTGDVYGKLYLQRKQYEVERNASGVLAEQAAAQLKKFKIGADKLARKHYEAGHLPPGHVDARARRWVVKLFLAHYHAVAYFARFKELPPSPYPIGVLGHGDEISVPNWPWNPDGSERF